MSRTFRFHLDEHCNPAIAAGHRLRGVDVTTTPEAHLLGAANRETIAYGMATGRVVFTHHPEFLRLHVTGMEHRGIAFCRQHSRGIGQMIASLCLICEVYEPGERVELSSSPVRLTGSRSVKGFDPLPAVVSPRFWKRC
jgi:hypothetical protein